MSNISLARWNVRIVRCGENYGKDNCLTYGEKEYDQRLDDNGQRRCDVDPLVEFYDMTIRPDIWGDEGYFYGRYCLSTIVDDFGSRYDLNQKGFCLYGGTGKYDGPAVYIEPAQMNAVLDMLEDLPEAKAFNVLTLSPKCEMIS